MKPHFLGFISLHGFLTGVFGDLKQYKMNHILPLVILGTSFISFIEQWIWTPAWSLLLFSVVYILDFFAAVAVSIKKRRKIEEDEHKHPLLDDDAFFKDIREGISTRKALRAGLSLMASLIVIAIIFNLEKLIEPLGDSSMTIFSTIAIGFFVYWVLINIVSTLKHLSILGVVPKGMVDFFIKYVDTHKNIISKKIKKEEDADTIH